MFHCISIALYSLVKIDKTAFVRKDVYYKVLLNRY